MSRSQCQAQNRQALSANSSAMPLVTPTLSRRGQWARRFGSAAIVLGLIATSCTNTDTTDASLDSVDSEPTTTVESTPITGNTGDATDLPSSDQPAGFVEQPVPGDPYWTKSTESVTPDTNAAVATSDSPSTTAKAQEQSLGTKPKKLSFTERVYDVPEKSYVATVTGDGVSSLENAEPGAAKHWFPNPTQFGNERVFLVLDDTTSADYIKISLPVRPNGQEGWIPRDSVTISEVQHYAVVDLTNDALTVWDGDNIVVQTKVVTGKRSTPTPVGEFFVRDIIKHDNPGGAYGPYIIALSAFSEVLETFAGGLPAVAIHGTNKPWLIGGEYSSGCIRIPNDLIQLLAASVPPGTPVTILN